MRTAAYDAHADWYEEYVTASLEAGYTRRVHDLIRLLLGPGAGGCLDVCCGTGVPAPVLRELGWTPAGVDLSRGPLRHAAARLPVAGGDPAAPPAARGSGPAAGGPPAPPRAPGA